jgi:hypothetical protein
MILGFCRLLNQPLLKLYSIYSASEQLDSKGYDEGGEF